ncbi:MAG TPA: archaetidylserine decarboxylase [Steroidobacteraceae bacterium]|nr:archaetidylserine decarboxylase [Steroidobacteraceae bacterium]
MNARLFVALQYLLPQLAMSRLVGWIARARIAWIRKPLVNAFVRAYRPELADAAQPDPAGYDSFNAFFTRALRSGARPISSFASAIVSPVDGRISGLGSTIQGRIIQAKGRDYSLPALLAGNTGLATRLQGGPFMTVYLAPYNYHRIHMALEGSLVGAWYVPGRLFSVNERSAALVPNLFARNERVILEFAGHRGPHVLVMVGALFVGSMATVWHGDIARRGARGALALPLPAGAAAYRERGAELGRFNMGSTVILLLPPGSGVWDASLAASTELRVGQGIGTLSATPN